VHSHSGFVGVHSHEGGAPHWHDEFGEHLFEDLSAEEFAARQLDWRQHNVQIVTIGVDIGSSTSHLAFSRLELRQQGTRCEPVAHNRMDRLAARVASLAPGCGRVFYLCDGVYSMHGDRLPLDELRALLDRHPSLFAYVDDAHGVGWTGRHGAEGAAGGRSGSGEPMPVRPRGARPGMLTRPRLPWIRLLVGLILVVGVMAARAALKDPTEPFWRFRASGSQGP